MNIENQAIIDVIKDVQSSKVLQTKASQLHSKSKWAIGLFWFLVIYLIITLIIYGVLLSVPLTSMNDSTVIAINNCVLAIAIVSPFLIFIIWILNLSMIYYVGFFKEYDRSFKEIGTILFLGAFFIIPTVLACIYINRTINNWNNRYIQLKKDKETIESNQSN